MSNVVTKAVEARYRDSQRSVVDLQDKGGQVYLLPGSCVVWYLAVCGDCSPTGPMPFNTARERDRWVAMHMTTGHRVHAAIQVITP